MPFRFNEGNDGLRTGQIPCVEVLGGLRDLVQATADGHADVVSGRTRTTPWRTGTQLQELVGKLEAALPGSQGRERVALQLTLGAIKAHAGAIQAARAPQAL